MGFSWLVKSPKKEDEQEVPNSIWEDDFKAFFEVRDEDNPPPVQQPDYHFHHHGQGGVMENKNNKVCLNLNLNYEEVLEAWSGRGSLWAAASCVNSNDPTQDSYVSYFLIINISLIAIFKISLCNNVVK